MKKEKCMICGRETEKLYSFIKWTVEGAKTFKACEECMKKLT
jgi:ribosome-binding protein aMBF1 (putative translation factor)